MFFYQSLCHPLNHVHQNHHSIRSDDVTKFGLLHFIQGSDSSLCVGVSLCMWLMTSQDSRGYVQQGYKREVEGTDNHTTSSKHSPIINQLQNLQLHNTTAKMRSSILIIALLLAIIAVACSAQRDGGGRGGGRGRPRGPPQGGRDQDRSDSSQGE